MLVEVCISCIGSLNSCVVFVGDSSNYICVLLALYISCNGSSNSCVFSDFVAVLFEVCG